MVDGREDLPSVSPQKFFDVTLLRKLIAGDSRKEHNEATALDALHSAVLVQERCGGTERESFVIEFDAVNFDRRLLIPIKMVPFEAPVWNNSGVVGWYPGFDPADWPGVDAQTFVGGVRGSQVNAWLDETPAWHKKNPHYYMYSEFAADEPSRDIVPRELFKPNVCHTFSAWNLGMLHAKGANFSWNQNPICRDTVSILGRGHYSNGIDYLTKLDLLGEPNDWVAADYFYWAYAGALNESAKTHSSFPFQKWLAYYKKFVFHNESGYYMGHLKAPYYLSDKKHRMRPMELPWQNPAILAYGRCQFRENESNLIVV